MTGQQYPTREQIAEVRALIEKHQPEEWDEDWEGGGAGVGCSHCAGFDSNGSLGDAFPCEPRRDLEAVLALFPQPVPSAEPKSTYTAAQVQEAFERGCIRGEQDANERNWSRRQYEKMQASLPAVAPPSVADMAPGTTFTAVEAGERITFFVAKTFLGITAYDQEAGEYFPESIDPSTIRDVTPPPATREVN